MTASLRRTRPRKQPGAPAVLHAPLFRELVARLDETERHIVLDLGAASTPMLALLSRARSRVEVTDFVHFGGIDRLNTTEPGPELVKAAESLLPGRLPEEDVDLILCWDLPNYLTLDALSALMNAIGHRARPGALAHALIFYAEPDMQESPGRFIPTADGELMDCSPESKMIAAPRYSPEALSKNSGRFVIDRARLLSNGMQEFLFRLDS